MLSGLGPSSPELSSNLPFCLQGPRVGGKEAETVKKMLEPSQGLAVLASEVKLIQVPSVLTARRAPHTAVITLQLSLSLTLFIGLFCSLHLGGKGAELEVLPYCQD